MDILKKKYMYVLIASPNKAQHMCLSSEARHKNIVKTEKMML